MKVALGIDIGGTNVGYGLVNELGEILVEGVLPTREFSSFDLLVNALYNCLEDKLEQFPIIGIGVGAPNGNHFTGNIEFAPNLPWRGIINAAELFTQRFNCSTILTNDANAAAVGEMLFGCAVGIDNFVTITLGTGLGSGVVVDGKIVYGAHGFAGEYGHIRVVHKGRTCGCGRLGCLETYVSATGVVRSIKELESQHKASSSLMSLENPSSFDVAQHAEEGDEFANEIIDYTAWVLGESLADFMCFSNPSAFVLFGGCARIGDRFAQKVKEAMEHAALNIYKNKAEVLISTLQDRNAAVLGNAAIVFDSNRL